MKKSTLNVVLFLVPVFSLAVLNLSLHGNAKVSSLEQREIQQLPALTYQALVQNTFPKDFDKYFSDNFIFRTSFLETGSWLKTLKGTVGSDVKLVANKGGNNANQMLGGSEAAAEGEPVVNVQEAEAETYLVLKDRAMSLYQFYPESAASYADAINKLQAAVSQNIHVYALLAPSSVEFIEAEKYKAMSDSQQEAFQYTASLFDPAIRAVPAYDKLKEHRQEYIHFRTDHHWTALGAYYAYEALMETIGEKPVALEKYTTRKISGFLGSSYSATLSPALKKNPDTITVYDPLVKYKSLVFWDDASREGADNEVVEQKLPEDGRSGYSVFMGGDYPLVRINTEANSARRLLLVKDSYANALIPFLLPHFKSIAVVDPRHFKGSLPALVRSERVTDILTVNSPIVTTYSGIADLIRERLR